MTLWTLLACAVQPLGPWLDLDISGDTVCGITAEGDAYCWGRDTTGNGSPRHGSFERISVGSLHTCALDGDGRAACWGAKHVGGLPASMKDFLDPPREGLVDVEAAGTATCWIDTEGAIGCLGDDGIVDDAPEGTFVALSMAERNACALAEDGSVTCWGTLDTIDTPEGAFVAVSAGYESACAIAEDGGLTCWPEQDTWDLDALLDGGTPVALAQEVEPCVLLDDGRFRCIQFSDVVEIGTGYDRIAAGSGYACGIRDGEVCCSDGAPEGAP